MSQFISVNHAVCTGCRTCEVVCSLHHFGECNPSRAAIRVIRKERGGLVSSLPLVCQHCLDPSCIAACPSGAISRDPRNASLKIEKEKCTGCGLCTEACPAGCIFMDAKRGIALACDLCGGRPQCVSLCHSQCLALGDAAPVGNERVNRLANILDQEGFRAHAPAKGGA